jgi:hypothetical protein
LKRSGVAITVTSLTDFIAFAVGGTTVRLKINKERNKTAKCIQTERKNS